MRFLNPLYAAILCDCWLVLVLSLAANWTLPIVGKFLEGNTIAAILCRSVLSTTIFLWVVDVLAHSALQSSVLLIMRFLNPLYAAILCDCWLVLVLALPADWALPIVRKFLEGNTIAAILCRSVLST